MFRIIYSPSLTGVNTTILIGHSLEYEHRALRISHLTCIDTSLLYPHTILLLCHTLRYLARRHLSRDVEIGVHFMKTPEQLWI